MKKNKTILGSSLFGIIVFAVMVFFIELISKAIEGTNYATIIIPILVCLFYAIGIPVSGLMGVKYIEEYNFQCTRCFHVFDIYEYGLNSFNLFTKLYVKCPKCGRYSPVKFVKKEREK